MLLQLGGLDEEDPVDYTQFDEHTFQWRRWIRLESRRRSAIFESLMLPALLTMSVELHAKFLPWIRLDASSTIAHPHSRRLVFTSSSHHIMRHGKPRMLLHVCEACKDYLHQPAYPGPSGKYVLRESTQFLRSKFQDSQWVRSSWVREFESVMETLLDPHG